MKTLRYLTAGVLIVLSLLMAMVAPSMPSFATAPAQPYVMGIVFIAWGALLIQYQKNSYKGGASTIVGAFLLGIGLAEMLGELFWKQHETSRDFWVTVIAEIIFVSAGLALVVQGHRVHKANAKSNQDI